MTKDRAKRQKANTRNKFAGEIGSYYARALFHFLLSIHLRLFRRRMQFAFSLPVRIGKKLVVPIARNLALSIIQIDRWGSLSHGPANAAKIEAAVRAAYMQRCCNMRPNSIVKSIRADGPIVRNGPVGAWRSPVSAPVWGTGGRGFKSRRPDQKSPINWAFLDSLKKYLTQNGIWVRYGSGKNSSNHQLNDWWFCQVLSGFSLTILYVLPCPFDRSQPRQHKS